MNTTQAQEMGKKAQEEGRKSVPALDKNFMDKLPSNEVLELLEAWLKGWHKANCAEMIEAL